MFTSFKLNRKIRGEYRKSSAIQRFAYQDAGINPTRLAKLTLYKKSDTLFVFGSGASVLTIEDSDWNQISKMDSIGLNLWTIHPLIPTYYTFELPRLAHVREIMVNNYQNRLADYKKTAVILKAEASYDKELLKLISRSSNAENVDLSVPAYCTIANEAQLIYLLNNYHSLKRKHCFVEHGVFFRKRASVLFATMLGYDLGYKNIVFCGVDGFAGSGYFYHDTTGRGIAPGASVPSPVNQPVGAVHKTMSTEHDSLNVDYCLQLMFKHLYAKNGVSLWVGTPNSMLSEWMPAWKWLV